MYLYSYKKFVGFYIDIIGSPEALAEIALCTVTLKDTLLEHIKNLMVFIIPAYWKSSSLRCYSTAQVVALQL